MISTRATIAPFAILLLVSLAQARAAAEGGPVIAPLEAKPNTPEMIQSDGTLRLSFGDERIVLPHGLQPSLLCTRSGTLVIQAQVPDKPFPSNRMTYFSAMCTEVSRDGGQSWTTIPLEPGKNGLNMEAGAIQLRDGTIIALDTYVTPGSKSGEGIGQLYTSTDVWKTLAGPRDVLFDMPNA
jgi:hypothetical protein